MEPQPQRPVDTQSVHVTVCPIIAPSINGVQSVQSIIASLGIVPLEVNTKEVPAGRLKHFLSNWEHLTRDRWILNTVGGYQIEFSPEPSQFRKPYSPHFSQVQDQLIREEVGELQRKGAVTEVTAPMEGGFYSTLFLVPKKDGGQPESPQRVCCGTSFQDGGHTHPQKPETRRLPGKGGPKGRLFLHSYSSRPQKILMFPTRGKSLSIHLPPLRPHVSTIGLYQDPKADCSFHKRAGAVGSILHRRYSPHGGVQGETKRDWSTCCNVWDLP